MSKLISVSDLVYSKLTEIKRNNSYSEVIIGLFENKCNKDRILSFAGTGGIDEHEVKKIGEEWKSWSKKFA